jgi:hypothetical protein
MITKGSSVYKPTVKMKGERDNGKYGYYNGGKRNYDGVY